MRLGIVIPALNEEQSIGSTVQRTLDAAPGIIASSPVTAVSVTVVSDGSTDRTVEIAEGFGDQIRLIVFEKNRGYGAAIKEGWAQMPDADLLAFLDADGTCDPAFFTDLATVLEEQHADIALGCRLNANSEMPRIRRIGNRLFAVLLSGLASTSVRDTASGMRVVRRTALPLMMPLPDGLHFTPAMSARAILSGEIKVVETDMPYKEREGRSKLSVMRDGRRFLETILRTAALYRPMRILGALGLTSFVASALLFLGPAIYYLQERRLQEWMIYRFVVGNLAGVVGAALLSAGYIAGVTVDALLFEGRTRSRARTIATRALQGPPFWIVEAVLLIGGGLLVLPSAVQLVETGATLTHWSRFIVMSLSYEVAAILAVTKIAARFLSLASERATYQRHNAPYGRDR